MIGDLDGNLVSDRLIQLTLSLHTTKDTPVKEYLAAQDSLIYAIKEQSQTGARRREKEGNVEIEVYGAEQTKSLERALNLLKENPPTGIPKNRIIFGGVSIEEYNRVLANTDRLASEASIGWFDRDIGQGRAYPSIAYVNGDEDGF